jgi:hypothetical protein
MFQSSVSSPFMLKYLFSLLFIIGFWEVTQAQQSRDHIALGIGSSFIYGENTGNFSRLQFQVSPAITFSHNKQLSHHVDFRSTLGGQRLESGGYIDPNDPTVRYWSNKGQAFDFTGFAYFADIMPVYLFNPNLDQRVGDVVHFYAGLGIGIMHVARKQDVLAPDSFDSLRVETSKKSTTSAYIPLRIGVSSNFDFMWDYAVEFSALTATSSNIDGNNLKNKLIYPDILFQVQVKVKKYISR